MNWSTSSEILFLRHQIIGAWYKSRVILVESPSRKLTSNPNFLHKWVPAAISQIFLGFFVTFVLFGAFLVQILQDKAENDRIYIPQQTLAEAGLTEDDITSTNSRKLAPLLRHLFQQTMDTMNKGIELGNAIQGRLGWEIRAMTLGGIETLNTLMTQNDDNILSRPRLTRTTQLKVLLFSLSKNYLKRH